MRKLLSVGGALATALGPGEEAFKRGSYAFPFTRLPGIAPPRPAQAHTVRGMP